MNIRRMKAADLDAVVEIDIQSFSLPWPANAFALELVNPGARCWVAESQDLPGAPQKVIAALVIWRVLDEAHIATLAVDSAHRRQGIGRLLMQAGMRAAYAEGARLYHLEVRAGNLAAQKMYFDLGYEIVGRRPRYYKDNGEDALLMTLNLTGLETNPPVDRRLNFLMEASHDRSRNPGPDCE